MMPSEKTRWERWGEFFMQAGLAILHPIATWRAFREDDTE